MSSQVMTTIQEVQSAGLTEIELLAQLQLNFNDELRCEAYHQEAGTICSVEVTHRLKIECIDTSWRLVCLSTYEYVSECVFGGICGCGEECEDCWKIIPI